MSQVPTLPSSVTLPSAIFQWMYSQSEKSKNKKSNVDITSTTTPIIAPNDCLLSAGLPRNRELVSPAFSYLP